MRSSRSSVVAVRAAVAVALAAAVLRPLPARAQEDDGGGNGRGRDSAEVDIEIDVLRVEGAQVSQALADIEANVEAQRAQLSQAQTAKAQADAELGSAQAAIDQTQAQIDQLTAATDAVVIDAFTNPPTETALETLAAESLSEVSVKQSILNSKATSDAETLASYQALQDQLEVQMGQREEAARAAEARASDAEAALADLRSALSQQALFAVQVEERLQQRLAEAASLEQIDPALAEQIRAREGELAAFLSGLQAEVQAEAARERAALLASQAQSSRGYGVDKHPPGGVTSVPCPAGGSIDIAGDIAGAVGRLLNDAAADGITMCGNGYRDPAEQIAVRRQNCGSSNYAIYEAPASSCSPPTAQPGRSMHEQALAIDFTCGGGGAVSTGDECHDWLEANAADYGLYQLPSESWHWSVNGQ